MVKLFKSLIFAILVFPFLISNAETNSPYWAGFESKQIPSNDGLSDFIITIKYSKDGKKYKITYLNESPHVEGTCEGEIYKEGDLEEIECEKDSGGTRTISGTVTEITLESSGSAGGGVWKLGKELFARKNNSQKLEKKTLSNPFLTPLQKMSNMNVFSGALSKLKQKTNTGIELEKKEKNKTKNLLKRKTGTSYLESSRYMHIYKKLSGWDYDPETMTYADGSNRIHLGILKSYEDIGPEDLKYIGQIFPLKKGKKFTYDLSRGSSEWQYIAEVKEEYKKKDPHLGEIYCFRIEGTFENKWSSWIREREGIICPVYGMSFQFLDTGSTVKIKKEVTTYKKLLSLWKTKTAFRVESKKGNIKLINLLEEKTEQLRFLEVKRKKEQEKKAELERKRKAAKLARKKRFEELRKKRAAELARKKRAAELARKKREAELARKKKQAELARKKEFARNKLLAKRKLEAEKKRQKIIAAKKRKRELLLKLFPPLSLEANKLSNDIQLFLQKYPDTPNLIEIATLIGKIKQSQKRKEVPRLKKSIKTLRTLLTKVKGFSAFETKREKIRNIARLKLLNKKIKSGKDLRNFLRSYVARNMLNDSKTVQKILPVLKNLDASLKSPKLDELNKLIPKIQKFILTTSSLKKEVVKLRKKKELARQKVLEAKRKKQMEIIRKRKLARQKELEAKRKRALELARKKRATDLARRKKQADLEAKRTKQFKAKQKQSDKKKLLAVRKKVKELKRKALPKENKPKKKDPKMDDFQISEIVQKKIKEKKFKEAKHYAKKIQDSDIRNLFLQNIQLQDKSKTDKKNKPLVKKKTLKKKSILSVKLRNNKKSQIVNTKNGEAVLLKTDKTWEFIDISSLDGKVVFTIIGTKDYIDSWRVENEMKEFKHYVHYAGCRYILKIENKTKYKVKVGSFELNTENTSIFSGDMGPFVFGDSNTIDQLLEPGAKITGIPIVIRKWAKRQTSQKLLNEKITKSLLKKYGCEVQNGSVYISEDDFSDKIVYFSEKANLSSKEKKLKVIGSPYGVRPLKMKGITRPQKIKTKNKNIQKSQIVNTKDSEAVLLKTDKTWEFMDLSGLDGKVVFTITGTKDYIDSYRVENEMKEFKHYAHYAGCKYELKIENKTKYKVKINSFELHTENTRIFSGDMGPFVFGDSTIIDQLLEPGAKRTGIPIVIRKWAKRQSSKKLPNEKMRKSLLKKYGCEVQNGSIYIRKSFSIAEEIVDFDKKANLSTEAAKLFVIANPNGAETIKYIIW